MEQVEREWENDWLGSVRTTSGWCSVCQTPSRFVFDLMWGALNGLRLEPAWTETFKCLRCDGNARMRNAIGEFRQLFLGGRVYLHEGFSNLAEMMFADLGNDLVASEFGIAEHTTESGLRIRSEDLTKLSFDANEFDFQISLDVLEHVPDYEGALKEIHRTTKPGGFLILTTPIFGEVSQPRAYVDHGEIVHLLEPSYHGDPQSGKSNLVFTDFGTDLLEVIKSVGFAKCTLKRKWQPSEWILGGRQFSVICQKNA